MVLKSSGEVLFYIGKDMPVYKYGIIVALACLIGVITAYFVYKRFYSDKNSEKIWDFSAYALIGGIIGARLYYCLLNFPYYIKHLTEIFNIRGGGMSIHGGLAAGICILIIFAKNFKLGVLKVLDAFACGTALAQSIGRWGNFFNSEAFGLPTNLPWKLYIPESRRPEEFINYDYFHPTFLYESILDLLSFIILVYVYKRFGKEYRGLVFFSYLILYALIRFFVEKIRIDSALYIASVPIAQIVSIVLFVIGLIGIICIKKFQK
jgi:phosphatidylglycerol:prolipoprotein diacylglycerol transferase